MESHERTVIYAGWLSSDPSLQHSHLNADVYFCYYHCIVSAVFTNELSRDFLYYSQNRHTAQSVGSGEFHNLKHHRYEECHLKGSDAVWLL